MQSMRKLHGENLLRALTKRERRIKDGGDNMEVAEIEFRRRKVRWVEVCCMDCENLEFNEDEIFPLKCKISNVKMDFDTAEKKNNMRFL